MKHLGLPAGVALAIAGLWGCTDNRAPTLSWSEGGAAFPAASVTVAEGQVRTLDLTGVDPEGSAVGLFLAAGPRFASFDPRTGRITLAPSFDDAGNYALEVVGTDKGEPPLTARARMAVVVTNVNRPPKLLAIGSLDPAGPMEWIVDENERFTLDLRATDPDPTGSELTFEVGGLPAGAAVNSRAGVVVFTPSFDLVSGAQGELAFPLTFTVRDSDPDNPLSETVMGTLRVRNVNRPPSFTAMPQSIGITEGTAHAMVLMATDADNDPVTYSARWEAGDAPPSLPVLSAAVDPVTGAFSYTPGFEDGRARPYVARFTVSDAFGGESSATVSITVQNLNRAPKLTVTESASGPARCAAQPQMGCTVAEGETVTLSVSVSDDPEDTIGNLEVRPRPAGASFVVAPDRKSALFSWTAGFDQGAATPTTLTFIAEDQGGLSHSVEVPVNVTQVNRSPGIALAEVPGGTPHCGEGVPLLCTLREDETLVLELNVTDDPGEEVSSLTATYPAGVELGGVFSATPDNKSATFSLTPGFTDAANVPYEVSFTATDAGGLSRRVSALITIVDNNRAPTLMVAQSGGMATCPTGSGTSAEPLLCSVAEGSTLALDVRVADEDLDDRVALLSLDAPTAVGAVFTPDATHQSGIFFWSPSFAQAGGPYPLAFTARDMSGAEVSYHVSVTIDNVNRAPRIALLSGVHGNQTACRGEPPVCYVDHVAGGDSTLVLRLDTSDPDGDDYRVRFYSDDLPQIGTAWDPVNGVLSFTPADSTPSTFTATFEATDADPDNPLTSRLTVTIVANAKPQRPTVTLAGNGDCPETVVAGETLRCTITVSDPDPRDAPLSLSASFLPGTSFSYSPADGVGVFTYVPPSHEWGTGQVDFLGADTQGLSHRVSYVFTVLRREVAVPTAFPTVGGTPGDVAYRAPFLYVAGAGFLATYNVVDSSRADRIGYQLVPGGARSIASNAQSDTLAVLGESLKLYSLTAPNTPKLLYKFNLPFGAQSKTVAMVQPPGAPADFIVAYQGDPRVDVVRFRAGQGPPRLVQTLDGSSLVTSGGIRTLAVLSHDPPRLLVTSNNTINQIFYDAEAGRYAFDSATNHRYNGFGQVSFGDSGSGRLGVEPGIEGPGWEVSIPMRTLAPASEGFGIFHVDPDGTLVAPVHRPTGHAVLAAARIAGQGLTLVAATAGPGVRLYDDSGVEQATLDLPGGAYQDVLVAGQVAFASASRADGKPAALSLIDLASPTSPAAGQQSLIDVEDLGQPAVFKTQAGRRLLYLPRRTGATGVYDITSLPATPRVSELSDAGRSMMHVAVQGRFLVAHGAGEAAIGTSPLTVFDLGTSEESPPPMAPLDFEVPVAADPSDLRFVLPFTGSAGEDFLYLFGKLCVPTCASGSADGAWLIQIGSGGLILRTASPVSVQGVSSVILGNGLYSLDVGAGKLRVYSIENPVMPAEEIDQAVDISDIPLDPADRPVLLGGNGILLLITRHNSESGSVFFARSGSSLAVRRGGRVFGVGRDLAGHLVSSERAYISTSRHGVLGIDYSDVDHPTIVGGLDAPTNAIRHFAFDSPELVATERTSSLIFTLIE